MKTKASLQDILLHISKAVINIRNLEDFHRAIMDYIKPYVKFDDAVLVLLSEDRKTFTHPLTMSPKERVAHPNYNTVIHSEFKTTNTPIENILQNNNVAGFSLTKWLKKYPTFPGLTLMKETGLNHSISLQLENSDGVFGIFLFHFENKPATTATDDFYKGIKDQLAMAVGNILANEEIVKEKENTEKLLNITKAISNIGSGPELVKAIFNDLQAVFPFDEAGLFHLDFENERERDFIVDYNIETISKDSLKIKEAGITGWLPLTPLMKFFCDDDAILMTCSNMYADFEHPHFEILEKQNFVDIIAGRLVHNNEIIGVLCFFSKQENTFDGKIELFKTIANQLSLALSNILANEEILKEKQFAETLLSISEATTNIRDRDDLYATVMDKLKPIVQFEDAVVIVLSEDGSHYNHLLTLASDETKSHPKYADVVNNYLSLYNSPFETIFNQKETVRNYSLFDDWLPDYPDYPGFVLIKDIGFHFPTVLKLMNGGKVFGCLLFHFKALQPKNDYRWKLYPNIADQLLVAIHNVLSNEKIQELNKKLTQEVEYLEEEIKTSYNFQNIIGASEPMQQVFEMVEQVASSSSTVIILGETGTGKELIARAIHDRSPRNERPLIKINCATLPAQLLESELFGHEKGSFTGATERRLGKFELAHQGTIFLDEIGELPLELQSKLLRVLQEREIERLGGSKVIKVDTRIITATNRNLEKEVQEGNFRADLFFRLNVFPVILPPLRNRTEDIPALADYFLERFSKKFGKKFKGISKATISQMKAYQWPGNVRELEHLIERAMITSNGGLLKVNIAQLRLKHNEDTTADSNAFSPVTLEDNQRKLIVDTLKHCGGRVRGKDGAAELLDINPSTLESRMRKLGIKKAFVAQT